MSERRRIGIDADDVLFDENNAIRLFVNGTYGTQHTAEEYLTPGEYWGYWENRWPVEPTIAAEWYEAFCMSGIKKNLPPKPGAVEALRIIKHELDMDPVLITSRSLDLVDATYVALDTHFPGTFSDAEFFETWKQRGAKNKADVLLGIGAMGLVDDSADNCRVVRKAGLTPVLFGNMGWSIADPERDQLNPVADWDETVTFLRANAA